MTTYSSKVSHCAVLRCWQSSQDRPAWLRLLGSWLAWRQVWRTLPGGWRQPGILCWPVANQRPVFRSRDQHWPIRGRCGDRNWPMRSEYSCPLQAGNHCHTALSWLTEMVGKPRFTLVDEIRNHFVGRGMQLFLLPREFPSKGLEVSSLSYLFSIIVKVYIAYRPCYLKYGAISQFIT